MDDTERALLNETAERCALYGRALIQIRIIVTATSMDDDGMRQAILAILETAGINTKLTAHHLAHQ